MGRGSRKPALMHPWRSRARRRLDQHLAGLGARVGPRPPSGWIRTIRDALGMSTMELGARLGVTRARVGQLEQAELGGSMPLSTLERTAAALNCRVCYFLMPNEPLEQMVRRQALDKATVIVAARMRELDFTGGPEETSALVEALAADLVDRQGLWHPNRPRERK